MNIGPPNYRSSYATDQELMCRLTETGEQISDTIQCLNGLPEKYEHFVVQESFNPAANFTELRTRLLKLIMMMVESKETKRKKIVQQLCILETYQVQIKVQTSQSEIVFFANSLVTLLSNVVKKFSFLFKVQEKETFTKSMQRFK